ncbi:hypothetical protein [Sorangium sp. So ce124]|uniref:hypothetical protein n=1 Tax=Sorangium sp. So ce124 TaxID=3133280 RepID=UPI003F634EB0
MSRARTARRAAARRRKTASMELRELERALVSFCGASGPPPADRLDAIVLIAFYEAGIPCVRVLDITNDPRVPAMLEGRPPPPDGWVRAILAGADRGSYLAIRWKRNPATMINSAGGAA